MICKLLRQLPDAAIFHAVGLAMMDARGLLPLRRSLGARVAQVGRHGHEEERPPVRPDFPQPELVDPDAELPYGDVMLDGARHLAGMAPRAPVAIDEETVLGCRHAIPLP